MSRHTARNMGLKQVNIRVRPMIHEDGRFESGPVPLYLDSTGTPSFVFLLPEYVSGALGTGPRISAETADKAEEQYKRIVVRYQEYVRTAKAEPVIILRVSGRAVRPIGESQPYDDRLVADIGGGAFWMHGEFGDTPAVGLAIAYDLAFRVNGEIHHRKEPEAEGKPDRVGFRTSRVDGTVLDYTPELHDALDRIRETINRAALRIHDLLHEKDVAAALTAAASGGLLEHKAVEPDGIP